MLLCCNYCCTCTITDAAQKLLLCTTERTIFLFSISSPFAVNDPHCRIGWFGKRILPHVGKHVPVATTWCNLAVTLSSLIVHYLGANIGEDPTLIPIFMVDFHLASYSIGNCHIFSILNISLCYIVYWTVNTFSLALKSPVVVQKIANLLCVLHGPLYWSLNAEIRCLETTFATWGGT